jgi:hypothetical protein
VPDVFIEEFERPAEKFHNCLPQQPTIPGPWSGRHPSAKVGYLEHHRRYPTSRRSDMVRIPHRRPCTGTSLQRAKLLDFPTRPQLRGVVSAQLAPVTPFTSKRVSENASAYIHRVPILNESAKVAWGSRRQIAEILRCRCRDFTAAGLGWKI